MDAQCDESTYVEACEAGAGIGTTIGVMVVVFFWVAGLAVIALLWVVAKPEPASRSVPPPPVLRQTPPVAGQRVEDDPPGYF